MTDDDSSINYLLTAESVQLHRFVKVGPTMSFLYAPFGRRAGVRETMVNTRLIDQSMTGLCVPPSRGAAITAMASRSDSVC